VTAALILGALFGLGLVAAHRSLRPAPPPLRLALHRLERRQDTAGASGPGDRGGAPAARLGRLLAQTAPGLHPGVAAADLRVTGRRAEDHIGAKALLAVIGLLLPPAWAALVALAGLRAGLPAAAGAGALLALAGWLVPDLLLRAQAADRRRDFTTALGSYLDLVVISLAGGAGVEGALHDAASIGTGWAHARLRTVIDRTRLTGESPWAALGRLGDDLGVAALSELAASASLAGTEGARIRRSLTAKATALRNRQRAEAEADAQAATERMAVPTVLLLAGFMLLIGYPAVHAVLTGL
jgi:Flp pilus assembly protein TadB